MDETKTPTQTELLFPMENSRTAVKKAQIIRTDGNLVCHPILPDLKKHLKFERRTIGPQPTLEDGSPNWSKERPVVKRVERLYMDFPQSSTLMTMEGFYDEVVDHYRKAGYHVDIQDRRLPFPAPQLDKAFGFRGGQEKAFRELVTAGRSGGLKAPTRWGKSVIIINLLRVFPSLQTVIAMPGTNLLRQTSEELKEIFPDRDIKVMSGSKKKTGDITVCSMDSLHKLDRENTRLLIVDEPHALASEGRTWLFSTFPRARRYGVGATWEGRFDKADPVIRGVIGPVLTEVTFSQAVQDGNICPIRVYIVRIPFRPNSYKKREACMKNMVWENSFMHYIAAHVCKDIIPQDWQTIVFVDREKQAEGVDAYLGSGAIAMDKRFKNAAESEAFRERMVRDEIKRCIATSIYSTGLTFPMLRCMVNACAGGGSISSVQKPGRLAQIQPGKKRGYVFDYSLDPALPSDFVENKMWYQKKSWYNGKWRAAQADCAARRKVYETLGYEIVDVELTKNEQGVWIIDQSRLEIE